MLCHPCILGGPWQRRQNQKWLHWGQGQNFRCAVKKNTTKKNRRIGVSASKNALKIPPQTILKKGGGSETPHAIGFLRNPPSL